MCNYTKYSYSMSSQNILAVDLDGTLLKTDTLYETFWSALRLNWMTFFICIPLLIRGKTVSYTHLTLPTRAQV